MLLAQIDLSVSLNLLLMIYNLRKRPTLRQAQGRAAEVFSFINICFINKFMATTAGLLISRINMNKVISEYANIVLGGGLLDRGHIDCLSVESEGGFWDLYIGQMLSVRSFSEIR